MLNKKISKPEKKEVKISSKVQKLKFMQRGKLDAPQEEKRNVEVADEDTFAQAPAGEEAVSTPQVSREGQLWSLAQGIEGFYKNKGASDTMNLYKSVKYIPSSKILELQSNEGKSKNENKVLAGRKVFKKQEE